MMLQNKCELAYSLLSDAEVLPASHHDIVLQRVGDAKHLVLRAMEEMSADAVFCVLQDSTISFPSIASTNKSTDRQVRDLSPGKSPRLTPPRKSPKKIASKAVSKLRLSSHGDFVETLRQARDHVSAVHTMAVQMCSTPVVHTISAVLGGIVMLLSAASSGKGKGSAHPLLATYSMGIYFLPLV
jgi:separase